MTPFGECSQFFYYFLQQVPLTTLDGLNFLKFQPTCSICLYKDTTLLSVRSSYAQCSIYSISIHSFKTFTPMKLIIHKVLVVTKNQDWPFLQGFGTLGEWINLEVKLILRNKRPRTILFITLFFMLYGLIFYTKETYTEGQPGFLIFVGTLITGIFMMNYGQFLFSWQANHFDFTLTRPISLQQFLESKYWLLSAVTVACFLLSIPYVYYGWNILLVNTSILFFNLGVNIFVIMNMAMWAPKKIDLSKGGTFNYEGIGAAQWVMGIPILLGPYVIYLPFRFMGYPTVGILAIGFVGIVGIALRSYMLKITTARLLQQKHAIAAGFRKD